MRLEHRGRFVYVLFEVSVVREEMIDPLEYYQPTGRSDYERRRELWRKSVASIKRETEGSS